MFHKVEKTIRSLRSREWVGIIIITDFLKMETENGSEAATWKNNEKNKIYSGDLLMFLQFFLCFFRIVFLSLSSFQCLKYDLVMNEYLMTTLEWEQRNIIVLLFVVIVMCELWVCICKRLKYDDHHLSIASKIPYDNTITTK